MGEGAGVCDEMRFSNGDMVKIEGVRSADDVVVVKLEGFWGVFNILLGFEVLEYSL